MKLSDAIKLAAKHGATSNYKTEEGVTMSALLTTDGKALTDFMLSEDSDQVAFEKAFKGKAKRVACRLGNRSIKSNPFI